MNSGDNIARVWVGIVDAQNYGREQVEKIVQIVIDWQVPFEMVIAQLIHQIVGFQPVPLSGGFVVLLGDLLDFHVS